MCLKHINAITFRIYQQSRRLPFKLSHGVSIRYFCTIYNVTAHGSIEHEHKLKLGKRTPV